MKRILITGVAGFIGSHLSEKMLSQEYKIVGIDNFDNLYSREIKEQNLINSKKSNNFEFFELDIKNYKILFRTLKEYDFTCIVHLAAKAGVRPSIDDPIGYQLNNVYGTQNLLEFAKQKNINQFIFASSSSVYGNNPNVPWKETELSLKPISPYACSKLSCELWGYVYSYLYNLRFISLRFFTVYGPRQRPDLAIHKFVKLGLAGKPIPIYGDGSSKRDYTFIDDIIDGIVAAINYKNSNYEIINLGNNYSISLYELVNLIEKILNRKLLIQKFQEQMGDVNQTFADITKAKLLLNWEPKTNIVTGIEKFVKWFIEQ